MNKKAIVSRINRKISDNYIPRHKCEGKYGLRGREYNAIMVQRAETITWKRCEEICDNFGIEIGE